MLYYMKSKWMYVTELAFNMKEHVSMNHESPKEYYRNAVIEEVKVSSGRSKAIKFSELDATENILIGELETLGYKRESVTDPLGNHFTNWDVSTHSESE